MGTMATGSGPATLKDVWTIFDGLPLLYRTNARPVPDGSRTIIHIHGFAISGRYLLPTASRLASDYATYVPDLPGFGQSHRPPRPLTIDQLGDAVVRLMDQQGIDRAVLLGNSLGCPIIASLLDEHMDRIEAIVFVSPAGGLYNLPIYRGVVQMALAGLQEPPRMFPIALADYARYGLMPSIHLLDSMLHYPTLRRLRELVLPTLVVIGSRDPLVSEPWIARRAIALPHVTAAVIDGAAHAINFSHPDQLANVVRCFLEDRPITADPTAKGGVRVFQTPVEP
ncbi:MAG TPA: alpha/beta hydrolase [Candidatus Limnocylindrales bacterium]|nr:alpha/beta hydrolase [Candidatus Limnocylindrales bacterium]